MSKSDPGTADSSSRRDMETFELIDSLMINDTIPFNIYRSVKTGLTVCIVDVLGPIVNCHFALATETYNDDGLPEALARLVFMGCEEYPYTQLLNHWSNKCLSLGTETHTFQDYTRYSIKTSGSKGFYSLLPVYLEYILYPTLTEASFITNIYHITNFGDDGGTLFCDTLTNEYNGEYLTYLQLLKTMYPKDCAYSSIVKGTLNNIAKVLTIEEIRKYHKDFYRPENLTVLIVGKVNHSEVFRVLKPLEQKIISKGERDVFKRPWQTPVKSLTKSMEVEFQYSCRSCEGMYIRIAWQGPSTVNKLYDYLGFCLLSQYLNDTSDGVLRREFVKKQIPYEYYLHEFSTSALSLMFPNVPSGKVPLIKKTVMKVLKHISDVGIQLKEMKTVIHSFVVKTLNDMENDLHNTIATGLFKHMLYGKTDRDLDYRLNTIHYFKKLENESKLYWSNLYKKYFVDTPMIVVRGTPSSEMNTIFEDAQTDIKLQRVRELGVLGLARNHILFFQAMNENLHIPDEVLESIPVAGIECIDSGHKSYSTEESSEEQHPELDVTKLPLFTYLDHTDTNFIHMYVVMDTTSIARKYRKYIPLLVDLIMESPVKRAGQLIPYEEVIDELKADTVAAAAQISFDKPIAVSCQSSGVHLMLQLEYEKYEKGVRWIKELLYDTVLTVDRLKAVATKRKNDIAQLKTKGDRVANDLMKILLCNEDSNAFIFSLLHQEEFLTDVMKRLNDDVGQKGIIADIESSRKALLNDMILYMTVNITKLTKEVSDVYAPWKTFFADIAVTKKKHFRANDIDWRWVTHAASKEYISGCIVGLENNDNEMNAFFVRACPSIEEYWHPDLPALLLCLTYFDYMDGHLSILIRGSRAHDFEIFVSLHEGLLYLTINDATDLIGAYGKAKMTVERCISGKWSNYIYESAKSLIIYNIARKRIAMGNRADESLRCCRGLPFHFCIPLIQRIAAVTKDDMSRVGHRYIMPLFDPKACMKTIIVCNISKVAEINEPFTQIHHRFNLYGSFEEAYTEISKKL